MTEAFAVQVAIGRSPEEVWAALTDWDNAPRWMPGIDSFVANGPTEAGTTITYRARGKERPSEIASVDAGRRIVLRSTQGGVVAEYTYDVYPGDDDSKTNVTLVADCRTTGLIWNMLSPLIRRAVRRADSRQLELFEAYVEGTAAQDS